MSVPSKYLFLCARRKFGFNKKIRRTLLIVYVYYQPNSCTTPAERGLEEPFQDSRKKVLPAHVQQVYPGGAGSPTPIAHLGLFWWEHMCFPVTTESYRVYIGTSSQKADMYAFYNIQYSKILEPFVLELLWVGMWIPLKWATGSQHNYQMVGHGFC